MFEEDIFSEKGPSLTSWLDFRKNTLIDKEVNSVFYANLKGLTRLFTKHGKSF
jgi:hypothetical protein